MLYPATFRFKNPLHASTIDLRLLVFPWADFRTVTRRQVLKDKGLIGDQSIECAGIQTVKKCPVQLRRIVYRDAETGKRYVFLTGNVKLSAQTIVDIYKVRSRIELFFKWIKQNLKLRWFVGIRKNAVMTKDMD